MYIGMVHTKQREEYSLKTESFSEAWTFINETAGTLSTDVVYAGVHEDVRWNDGHYIHPTKEVAVMRKLI